MPNKPPKSIMPIKLLSSRGIYTPLAGLLLATLCEGPTTAAVPDFGEMLECLAQLETGTTDLRRPCAKIGRRGERSAWQISPQVWAVYCSAPFALASSDAQLASVVATAHLQWLRKGLERDDKPATPYNLALAWNAGLGAVLTGKAPPGAHDYAARAEALYESLTRSEAR